ncbi:MAG: hypothetical protein ACTJGD_11930 [Mesonia hippocampi]|uniref:Ig-like domain-containing protein n=1 Tax=Mesonia hippocampi TaxID=1628250 RepID=UPI003F9E9E5A
MRLIVIISTFLCAMVTIPTFAQFTITEDFRGGGSPDIIIGDDAYLTSGIDDPVNAGWLRLTSATGNQKGYAYINKSFPSTLGVLVDFEYTMWRDIADNSYHGADGFSVFLFDAMYGPSNFSLGAYGGSLGYANSTQTNPDTPGLTGGYIGIGFDAYGNFVRASEGKNGGSTGLSPNSIVLRGRTTSTNPSDPNTNKYLEGITILNNGNIVDALNQQGDPEDNVIDYNTVTSSRPSHSTFYRRVQIDLRPTTTGSYRIMIRWATTQGGAFTPLMDYVTNEVPPALLKLGFAASTGGGYNNHEIRNILVTTPGNLRVNKLVDKDIIRSVPGNGNENQIEYKLEIVNDTPANLSAINIEDKLTDVNGVALPQGSFIITQISADANFTTGTVNLPSPSGTSPITTGSFSGSVGLPANTSGIITVKGYLNNYIPEGNSLKNTVEVESTEITDEDLENNTATVNTPVIAEEIDLTLQKETVNACLDATAGNTFEVNVVNMGVLSAGYKRTGWSSSNNKQRIVVVKDVPSGYTYNDNATPGGFNTSITSIGGNQRWTKVVETNTPSIGSTRYIYIARGASNSDQELQGFGTVMPYPIRYTITPPAGVTSYTDKISVEYRGPNGRYAYDGGIIEDPVNLHNNEVETLLETLNAPTVSDDIVYYCQGQVAQPLTAQASSSNTLLWYTAEGGSALNNAPIPNTTVAATTSYYVSQTNGNCESELTQIDVIVLEEPTAGSITGAQTICKGKIPNQILNESIGTGFGTLSYLWEYSTDNGNTWNTISGVTTASYQPQKVYTTTLYRRITIAENTEGYSCQSAPTMPVQINVKNCTVITNPMLPSKAKK